MGKAPLIPLNDGHAIPQLGLGVWQLSDEQAHASSLAALEAGYRHIDTAAIYENEEGVGRALADTDVARDDIYLTTKLWNADQGHDATLRAFDASLKRLGTEHVDLYLIHWPMPERDLFVDTWRAFIRLREEGRVRSIGVSNFQSGHLQRLIDETGVTPAVNQVEMHPDFDQGDLAEFAHKRGILTESWSPLGQGGDLLRNASIGRIAERHGKSSAQVILRWHMQKNYVVIPRSSSADHVRSNIDLFDFVLDDGDMRAMAALDAGKRLGPHPDELNE